MFDKDIFVGVLSLSLFFFLRKHYAKRVTFKGILNFLNKAILWRFWTTVCGYFVYIVSIKAGIILMAAQAPPPPGTRPWLSFESSHRARLLWSALTGKCGKPGADFHLCPALPSNTLCGNSCHFLSDGVSYSDGCNGEWLVSFLFHFVLLFDGRWDEILALSASIQLKSILGFVFPSRLKDQGMY